MGIDWYDGAEGYADPGQPTLALGMENGRLQLQRRETDDLTLTLTLTLTRCTSTTPWATTSAR